MSAVSVRIVAPPAAPDAGPLGCLIAAAHRDLALAHRRGFRAAHAQDVEIIPHRGNPGPGGTLPVTLTLDAAGLALATAADYRRIVETVARLRPQPRTPEEAAEEAWRLAVRIDSPLDRILAARDRRLTAAAVTRGRGLLADRPSSALRSALGAATAILHDRRRQVLFVAARPTLPPWPPDAVRALTLWESEPRRVFDLDRPDLLAQALAPQADLAIVDTRVALATRLMRRRRPWPSLEDRFASDLLRPDDVADPWLRDLTRAAADAAGTALPILLGGPSLVEWGIRLLLTGRGRDPVGAGG